MLAKLSDRTEEQCNASICPTAAIFVRQPIAHPVCLHVAHSVNIYCDDTCLVPSMASHCAFSATAAADVLKLHGDGSPVRDVRSGEMLNSNEPLFAAVRYEKPKGQYCFEIEKKQHLANTS